MQANPSAPFVHPLSLALPCPVMTIITGEWLQRRDRQRASRAIGGWKPPYRVSPRSSMRADCHMLPLARRSAFPPLHREFDFAVENSLRWCEWHRGMAVGQSGRGQKNIYITVGRKLPYRGHVGTSRYRDTSSSEWTAAFPFFLCFFYSSAYSSWRECIVRRNMATAHALPPRDRCNVVTLFRGSFAIPLSGSVIVRSNWKSKSGWSERGSDDLDRVLPDACRIGKVSEVGVTGCVSRWLILWIDHGDVSSTARAMLRSIAGGFV